MRDGSYQIAIVREVQIIKISVQGTFSKEKADEFHQEYLNTIIPIETQDYILFLDSRGMDVMEKEMLPKLQVSFAMYKKSSFKEIVFIIDNDDIRKQITKLLYFSGIERFSYTTPEEFQEKYGHFNI